MKNLPNILLYTFVGLSGLWLVCLTLGVFEVFALSTIAGANFNFIVAFVLVLVCLALYIGFLFLEKNRNWVVPIWIKCLFFIAFFIFTNIYYFFGLYQTVAGLVIFDICLAALLNIVAVSLFYNTQKDNKNAVKTTDKFLCFSTFCYALTGGAIYITIASLVDVIAKNTGLFASLAMIVTELSIIMCVSLLFALMFALSMKGKRRFVNACLVKYIPVSDYKNNKSK